MEKEGHSIQWLRVSMIAALSLSTFDDASLRCWWLRAAADARRATSSRTFHAAPDPLDDDDRLTRIGLDGAEAAAKARKAAETTVSIRSGAGYARAIGFDRHPLTSQRCSRRFDTGAVVPARMPGELRSRAPSVRRKSVDVDHRDRIGAALP
jgi:hypothetical protein